MVCVARQQDHEDRLVRLVAREVDHAARLDALHLGLEHVHVVLQIHRVLEELASKLVRMRRIAAPERDELEEEPGRVFDLRGLDWLFAVFNADPVVVGGPPDRGASGKEEKKEQYFGDILGEDAYCIFAYDPEEDVYIVIESDVDGVNTGTVFTRKDQK